MLLVNKEIMTSMDGMVKVKAIHENWYFHESVHRRLSKELEIKVKKKDLTIDLGRFNSVWKMYKKYTIKKYQKVINE